MESKIVSIPLGGRYVAEQAEYVSVLEILHPETGVVLARANRGWLLLAGETLGGSHSPPRLHDGE